MKTLSFLLLSSLFMWGCGQAEEPNLSAYEQFLVDSIALRLPANKNLNVQYLPPVAGDTSLLAIWHRPTHRLFFYRVGEPLPYDTLLLTEESAPAFQALKVIARDSFLLLHADRHTLTIQDPQRQVLWHTYAIAPAAGQVFDTTYLGPAYNFPLEWRNGQAFSVHWSTIPISDPRVRDIYFQEDHRLELIITPDTVRNPSGGYPPTFQCQDYYSSALVRTMGHGRRLIYSFEHRKEVLVYDDATGQTDTVKLSNRLFKPNTTFSVPMDAPGYFDQIARYLIENTRFDHLYFDPYRERYYRVMTLPERYEQKEAGRVLTVPEQRWVLAVYDTSFNLLREVTFPGGKYYYYYIKIAQEGVLIDRQPAYEPSTASLTEQPLSIYDVFQF